jgi:sugar lactone lactonase YvrE
VALFSLVAPLPATAHHPRFPARIELPDGFRPEGITTGRGTTVYVGSLADGSIWRGNVRTGKGKVFIRGADGKVAVGVDYERGRNRLWVAGGPTGTVTAYDASTGDLLAQYNAAPGGFLNDLVVTRHAVYVTDSVQQHLVVVRLGRGGALPSKTETLPLTGDISFVPGFNANGIVAAHGGRILILVQSNTGLLFRVNPVTGAARKIDLGGVTLNGDGLELRGRTLYVVRGRPDSVSVVRLGKRLRSGRVLATLTDSLDVPSTATLAAGRLWVVNARFGTPPTPRTDYWITQLPRR